MSVTVLNTPCREWTGARSKAGYGQLRVCGKVQYSHRSIWATIHGRIPSRMEVCHRCDNPPCFEPDHLFLGTRQDNVDDAKQKGRLLGRPGGPRGPHSATTRERIRQSKLGRSNPAMSAWWASLTPEERAALGRRISNAKKKARQP